MPIIYFQIFWKLLVNEFYRRNVNIPGLFLCPTCVLEQVGINDEQYSCKKKKKELNGNKPAKQH
jgi:hypothetical protein